jgi:protein-tyrosine kinase
VSIIESALEKLRRSGASAGAQPGAARRGRAGAGSVPAARPGPGTAPPPEYDKKSITIDPAALRRAGYLPDESLERRFAEYYRRIKRPLIEQALAGGPDARLILVSSALPGDGKTFTSINLALSMTRERDVSVLLVDADVSKAAVSEAFGIRGEPGLIAALSDESVDVESLVVSTDIPGLEILPAGKSVEDSTELLASARMSQIATRLAADPHRLIVVDSAPLLAASEGRVLLPVAGQVVLVVRAGMTPQRAVLDTVALVDRRTLRGLVLNETPLGAGDGYYGYSGYGTAANDGTSLR